MLLDLSGIMDCPGASVPFDVNVDLSDLCFGSCYPIPEPVQASGRVRNTAGVLVMTGKISGMLQGVCDRCAADFISSVEYPIDVVLVTELSNEENEDAEVFSLEGNKADLEDIVRTVFVLSMDSKLLCKPDCKGLCCRCGKNLNDGACSCQKEMDPRFAALKQLLDK